MFRNTKLAAAALLLFASLLPIAPGFVPSAAAQTAWKPVKCVDSEIQQRAGWATHNPKDGSAIGGNMPANYGFDQAVPGQGTALLAYVQGGPYATMMAYSQRPWLYGSKLQTDFDLTLDAASANFQIIETDTILSTPDKYNLNGSVQLNYAEGGQLQIVNAAGAWVDVPGAKPGILAAGVHHYTVLYGWNATTHLYGVMSIAVDSGTYLVPASMQGLSGVASTWSPGATFQLQLTLNGLAAMTPQSTAVSALADNLQFTWME